MGQHFTINLTAYVDDDEGSVCILDNELFRLFDKEKFSLCISNLPSRKRYWLNSEGRNDKDEVQEISDRENRN